MLHQLASTLSSKVTGREVLLLFLFYAVLTVVLQMLNAKLKSATGVGLISYEAFYDSSRAHQLLGVYGSGGRQTQLIAGLIDLLLYIPAYMLFFSSIIAYFLAKSGYSGTLTIVNLFPFLVASINALKDIGIFVLLSTYPNQSGVVATGAGYLTLLEWIGSSVVLLTIFLSFLLFFWRKVFGNKRRRVGSGDVQSVP
jgi:hypothetical protein